MKIKDGLLGLTGHKYFLWKDWGPLVWWDFVENNDKVRFTIDKIVFKMSNNVIILYNFKITFSIILLKIPNHVAHVSLVNNQPESEAVKGTRNELKGMCIICSIFDVTNVK